MLMKTKIKSLKISIFKNPNLGFVIEDHWEENSREVWKLSAAFVGVAYKILAPIGSHINENEKYS